MSSTRSSPAVVAAAPAPLRVVHLLDIASVGSTLVAGLRELGVDAELVDAPRPGHTLAPPLRRLTAPLRVAALLVTAARLRGGGWDLVHAHYAVKAVAAPLAGRPYLVHCHGSDVRGARPDAPRGRLLAPILRAARAVYYTTPDLAAWVLPFRSDARFLPNPVDTALFAPAVPDDVPASPVRDVLVATRLDPVKGADAIVAAIAALARSRPATTFTIVAQGANVARARAAAGEHVLVVSPVEHAALPALLRGHRLTLGQFGVGALGNLELEAMATGVPVVADFRYPEAYPVPPPTGRVASGEAAAERLAALLEDPAFRAEVATAGRAWVVAQHGRHTIATRLLGDYRRLVTA